MRKPRKLIFHYNKDNSLTIKCGGIKMHKVGNQEQAKAFASGWFDTDDEQKWNYDYTFSTAK